MREDEFDFARQNPGELLAVDEGAKPFDYEALLHRKGYTKNSSPDAGELFKALATEYVPTVVVTLPPKVVEQVKIVRRLSEILIPFWFRLAVLASIIVYIPIIHFGWLGLTGIPLNPLEYVVIFVLYCGSYGPFIFFIVYLCGFFILTLIDHIYLFFLERPRRRRL